MLAAALRPRHPVCIHPSFTEPEAALRAAGLAVWRVFRNSQDFSLDPAAVPGEADLVVTCNPNNPTGNLDEAMALRALTRPGRIVVVDEAFMELSPGEPESLAMDSDLPGLLVVRSLTKVWSIPGVRAGYLLGPEEVVGALRAVRQPWSVNSVALRALAVCLRDTSTVSKVAAEVAAARQGLRADLKSLPGVMVWPSAANFLLIRVPDGPVVRAELLDRGMAVRRADTFPGLTGDHLRLAVRCPEDNRLLVRALREVLA